MSPLRNHRLIAILALGATAVMFGCSSPNSQSNFNPETGQHVSNWYPAGHMAAATDNVAPCADCHGADYEGGISGVSCRKCHINANPASFSCSECHGLPPAVGAHNAHGALPNVTCFACHDNTVGTSLHNNGTVNFDFNAAFTAKTGGTPTYNSGTNTCSNISCHGGQATPIWTGTLDINTQCTSCHQLRSVSDQYNSPYSGEHAKHVNQGILCQECHDTMKLAAVHFNDLNTPQMIASAQTITTPANYTGGTCTLTCHGETHNGERWF